MRKLFVWDKDQGQLVEIERGQPSEFHYVIQDTMDATRHPGLPSQFQGRKVFESKSAFRRVTKDLGLVELGSEMPLPAKEYNKKIDWSDVFEQAEAAVKRGEYRNGRR